MSLEHVKGLIEGKHFKNAIRALHNIDSRGESSAESQYLLGTIFHRMNQLTEAVDCFKRSLHLDPDFTDAAISLSVIYNDTGHYEEAEAIFEQAEKSVGEKKDAVTNSIIMDQEISEKHLELGLLYLKLQKFDLAANEFKKAARIYPKNVNARINLAKSFAQRGQSDLAIKELKKLKQEQPENIQARVQLALLHFAIGDTVEAHMELAEAHKQDPQNQQVGLYLSMTKNTSESTLNN